MTTEPNSVAVGSFSPIIASLSAMETATTEPAANSSNDEHPAAPQPTTFSPPHLVVGKLVNVISRTWPGINKPGGIGKITKRYPDDVTQPVKCVDVKYIVHGGTDKIIPVEFVEPHDDDGNRIRNTSSRCTRCKSFRSDCQNCDWRFEAEEEQRRQREEAQRRRLEEEMAKNDDDDDDCMDSEEEEEHMAKIGKRYRKLCRDAKARSEGRKGIANDTLAAPNKKKKKKLQTKNMKKRRKQSRNTSVLESLLPSTNESKVPSSNDKSVKEDVVENVADNAQPTSDDDEEMEFDVTTEHINQTPDSDDDESEEDDYDIENNNDYEMEDQEASGSDESDESDNDVKLNDFGKTDEIDSIKNIIDDITNTTIPYASAELSRLKGVLKELKQSMVKNDCLDELYHLYEEADLLHVYVVEKLIRSGVDECNNIMRSLTKKKRRKKTARMGKSERIRFNRQIEGLDLKAYDLGSRIEEVDRDVINFQKEVDIALAKAEDSLHNSPSQSHTTLNTAQKRKSNSSEKEWNPHQHASHKKSSSNSHSFSNKRTKNTKQPGNRSSHESSALQREKASIANKSEEVNYDSFEFDISSDVEMESRDVDDIGANRYQSIDSDSIGETDELDNGPAIQDTSRSWHTSSSKYRHNKSSGAKRERSERSTSSKKRFQERIPTYRHIRRERGSERAFSSTNSTGVQPRQSQGLIEPDRTNKSGSRESQRRQSSQSTRNNLAGHSQASVQSTTRTSSRRERVVPKFLTPENLFNSLPASQQNNVVTRGAGSHNQMYEALPQHHDNSSILTNEIYPSLRESYAQELDSCRETLSALSNSVPSGNEEVITLFQKLHTLLKAKCSTLLDVLNCDPQMACIQIDCWSVVFRLIEQKLHNQLPTNDVLWKVFGNSTELARHVILQIIDVLYSQLVGDGYGDAPRLTDQLFRRMRSLCRQMGKVVPILPELPNLFRNLPVQLWRSSLIYDEKEYTCEKSIYVSMLDPRIHERFIMEGEVVKMNSDSRIMDWYGNGKNIPRQEINAFWTTIGFFADSSPLPNVEKEKGLAKFVQKLLQSKCGVLPRNLKSTSIPASEIHLDRCLHEIKWLCHLLSNSMLGEVPFEAHFVPGIVKRAISLESSNVMLHLRATAPQEKMDRVMRQMWTSSSLGSSDQVLVGLTYFDSFFTQNKIDDVWCFAPSTSLSQTCAALVEHYAVVASGKTTKAHWNNFASEVDKMASTLVADAKAADTKMTAGPKSSQTNDIGTSFALLFPDLEGFSEKKSSTSPTGAYLRESACFSLLACVIASTRSDVFIPNANIALNKTFREKITNLSSDGEFMQEHHTYFREGMQGEAPKSTSNIYVLFTSSKILSVTILLHLSVSHDSVDKFGLDDDTSMLEYLTSSVISNLSASIDIMESLNLSIKETRNLFNLSTSCTHVIKSTAMWLGLIFHRATFIIKNVYMSSNKLNVLYTAIKNLAESSCSVAIKVLTKALNILFDTASTNKLGRSLNVDLALDKAFLCCLGAIRKVIGFVHACSGCSEGNSIADTHIMTSAFIEYQNFMELKVIPTTIGTKKSDAQDLCRRQSVGLLFVLATLCSTCRVPQTLYRDIFRQRKQDDDCQLVHNLRTAFSCELTRLSIRGFSKCSALAMQHFGDVLNDIIVFTFNLQSITVHPTSNTALLLKLGGEYSRRKGAEKLEMSQNTISSGSDDFDFGYMNQNLWSWCQDAGKLFCEWNLEDGHTDPDKKYWINSVGRALTTACTQIRTSEGGDPLQASAENECGKRRKLLRSVFSSMKQKNLSFEDLPDNDDGTVRIIAGCIKENLFYLSKTVSYYEHQLGLGCEDDGSRYERAKVRAYEETYTGFCGSVLSDLLKENGDWVNVVKDIIVKRLEAPRVDPTEKAIILKTLSRTFEIQNSLSSVQNNVGAYCSILRTLKTCLCDRLADRTGIDAVKQIFSCALHIVDLQAKTTSNETSTHVAYIHEFNNWLNICGILMQEEELMQEMCEVVAKLNSSTGVGKGLEPSNPKFTRLIEAFDSLCSIEDALFRRTLNPYAKQSVPSNERKGLRHSLKLSRSCLKTIKDFTDKIATSSSLIFGN